MRIALLGVLVALVLCITTVHAQSYVFLTSNTITIDGNLSDWQNSTAVMWKSPFSNVDYNFFFFTFNNKNYYVGAKIYDADNRKDDVLKIYLNNTINLYKIVLNEGSNTVTSYKYVSGNWTQVNLNVSAVYTKSNPWSYVEMSINRTQLNSSNVLYFYAEYSSDYPHHWHTYATCPCDATFKDKNKWEKLIFVKMENRTFNVTIKDYSGKLVDYTYDDLLMDINYTLNGTHITTLVARPEMNITLPPANVTVTLKFLDLPVFEKTYNLTLQNVTTTIYVNNLEKVNTSTGYVVISVVKSGELRSVDFDLSRMRGIISTRSREIFFDTRTPWKFAGVLYADSYYYNPATGHLKVCLNNTTRDVGLVLIIANNTPVMTSATNTVNLLFFNTTLYTFCSKAGKFNVSYSKQPFSVTFNDTELVKGRDYKIVLNNTEINTTRFGCVRIYYENPTSVKIASGYGNVKVFIATPYRFKGKINYKVVFNGVTVEDESYEFTATPPLTVINVNPKAVGDLKITVTDLDSGTTLYSTTVKALQPPYVVTGILAALLVGLAIVMILIASKKSKALVRKRIEEFRYFRRIK